MQFFARRRRRSNSTIQDHSAIRNRDRFQVRRRPMLEGRRFTGIEELEFRQTISDSLFAGLQVTSLLGMVGESLGSPTDTSSLSISTPDSAHAEPDLWAVPGSETFYTSLVVGSDTDPAVGASTVDTAVGDATSATTA